MVADLDAIETKAWLVVKARADHRMDAALRKLAGKRAKLDEEERSIRARHREDLDDAYRAGKSARWDAEINEALPE